MHWVGERLCEYKILPGFSCVNKDANVSMSQNRLFRAKTFQKVKSKNSSEEFSSCWLNAETSWQEKIDLRSASHDNEKEKLFIYFFHMYITNCIMALFVFEGVNAKLVWPKLFYYVDMEIRGNGILFPKLFWPTVRKNSEWENFWNSRLKAENLQKCWDH